MYISNILSHPSNSNNKALNQLLKEIDLHRTYPPDYLMPLFYLIKYNNINGIKMLAEIKDFNKNETDETGETALMYAIKNFSNNEKLIEQLLSSGVVNINGFNHEDINPLIYAIKQNNIDLIKLLLKYNPKINIENQKKVSPVKIAVIEKKIEILKLLINNTKKNKD